MRLIKFLFVIIYSFSVFVEKPFHCYKRTTFYSRNTKIKENICDPKIEMISIYIQNEMIYRIFEIFLLFSFMLIQIVFWSERKVLGLYSRSYQIMQISLFILVLASIGDIIIGLILDYFPLINFFARGIILIFLVKNLRNSWLNILYLFYDTKKIFFLFLTCLFWFGLLGTSLFKFSEDFKDVFTSMYSLFILLTTCNFPDLMLGTFSMDDKSSALFFVSYLIINFFIILSLLKSIYYSSYFEVYKQRARKIIKYLINMNEENQAKLANDNSFSKFLNRISENYSFTKKEYETFISLVNVNDTELSKGKSLSIWKTDEKIQFNFFVGFLRRRQIEFALTIFDVVFNILIILIDMNNPIIGVVLQLIWYSLFIYELGCYIYYMGLFHFIKTDLIRFLYLFINLLSFIGMFVSLAFIICGKDVNKLLQMLIPLVFLRCIRFMVLLNIFPEFRVVFTILHNMKTIFCGLIMSLFSFFLLFSTLSMFLTGGNITTTAFDDISDIPAIYKYLNFNDFASSFITCFALMMVNSLKIIAHSLSFGLGKGFRAYFTMFYFMSTLIILNIIQTLMLEMYLTIKAIKIEGEEEKEKEKEN